MFWIEEAKRRDWYTIGLLKVGLEGIAAISASG